MQKKLCDFDIGETGLIINVEGEGKLRRRLLDMGITRGVEVKVKKIAPLGDPIDIELRGYELCIRLSDLKNIDIKVAK